MRRQDPRPPYGALATELVPLAPRVENRLDCCEWDPDRDRPAQGLPVTYGGRTIRWNDYTGCPNPMAFVVGAQGEWRLCSSCAALPRFRRFRSRRPIATRTKEDV